MPMGLALEVADRTVASLGSPADLPRARQRLAEASGAVSRWATVAQRAARGATRRARGRGRLRGRARAETVSRHTNNAARFGART